MKEEKENIQNDLKIALSMIVEEHEPLELVKRAIESMSNAVDGVFVTVTYKEEEPKTSLLIEYLQSIKANISFWKWTYRFDEARNFSMKQISKDYTYYIWIDSDDVFQGADKLRGIAKEAYIYNWAAVFFEYLYAVDLDENGKIKEILVVHKRERLIRNDDTFKWIGRLHETLIEQRQGDVVKVAKKECTVVHLSTGERIEKNLDRNIRILEEAVKAEERKDPRTLMYLAKGYFDRSRDQQDEKAQTIDLQLAEALFMEYLNGSGEPGKDYRGGSGWAQERSTAWEYLGEIYRMNKWYNRAIRATLNALLEAPEFPNYYLDMALNYSLKEDFDKAQVWLDVAKSVPLPDTTIILMPRDLKARALEINYHIATHKNDVERAAKSCEKLVEIFPGIQEYKDRLDRINNAKIMNKVAQSIVYLGRYLESTNKSDKIRSLINSVPEEFNNEQFVSQMRHRFMPARIHNEGEIDIICGPGFEKWSPKNIDQGVGGSEAAVIYMARELVKLGHKVTVYGDPQEDAGEYEGVIYRPWYEANVKDKFDTLILWRAIQFTDTAFTARQTYLWAHDVPNVNDFTEERMKKIDKIFVLSQYHRSLFKMVKNGEYVDIPDDKFFLTANGIPQLPIKKIKRNPHRMIYASSYDRGLANLLHVWEEIKAAVPDAELDIYYGWNLFDKFYHDNPERMKWRAGMVEMMNQPGIEEHGRVSHKQLSEEFQRSGIFAYPCDFQEISCQNAMQAQLYGAIPVVTNYAALKETVKYGKKVNADVTSNDGKREYAQELIAALKDEKWQEEEREKMMDKSKESFLWESVAKDWDKLFKSSSKEVKS
jgi:glycosyltransferase involved in cell wall biosynthesis